MMNFHSLISLVLTAQAAIAASIAPRESLESCAKHALLGMDTAERVVTPESEKYTDARLGEKIQ